MTPLESELLENLGITFLYSIEELLVGVFCYGTSCPLMVYGALSLIKGIFVILFSASVVIFMFVFSSLRIGYFLATSERLRFHRRRGFSNRAIAAMFAVTVINFVLIGLGIATIIATFIVFFRKALTLDVEYPLSEKGESVNKTLLSLMIAQYWSSYFPVRIIPSPLDSMSIHARWRHYPAISLSFGGLGSSSKIDSG